MVCRSYLLISFLLILAAFSMWILFLHCSIYLVISLLSNHLPLHTASLFPPHFASHFSWTCSAISIYSAFTTHCQLLHHLHLFVSLLLYLPNFLPLLLFSDLHLNVHLATTSCLVSLFSNLVLHSSQFFVLCSPMAGVDICFYMKKVSHGCVMSQSVV